MADQVKRTEDMTDEELLEEYESMCLKCPDLRPYYSEKIRALNLRMQAKAAEVEGHPI